MRDLTHERDEWKRRAEAAEAKLAKVLRFIEDEARRVQEGNMALDSAAAADAALVEQFNG